MPNGFLKSIQDSIANLFGKKKQEKANPRLTSAASTPTFTSTSPPPPQLLADAPPKPTIEIERIEQPAGKTTPTQEIAEADRPTVTSQAFTDTNPMRASKLARPLGLIILDGWGIGPDNAGNAIALANTLNMDSYFLSFPHTQLNASGHAVGLPTGTDGNTETGHLNIGAGTIVYQDLPRINASILEGTFQQNSAILNAINHAKQNNSKLHFFGLVGLGQVHSNIKHLFTLLEVCQKQEFANIYIHGFTDGRDSPPTAGVEVVQKIQTKCKGLGVGQLASLIGRYYAMDRDKKWDRVKKAYNLLTLGSQNLVTNPAQALQAQYQQGLTDEFIEPISIANEAGQATLVEDNDAVIFFNYRVDRPRELTRAFVMPNFEGGIDQEDYDPHYEKYHKTSLQEQRHVDTFRRQKVVNNLYFVTMTEYDDTLQNVEIAFSPQKIRSPLGAMLASHGLRQLRITETEKERFVTQFMNGKRKIGYPGEDWVVFPSKGVKSYDSVPEMRAFEIADEINKNVVRDRYDVYIANICNGDMVGHTGNLEAAITACEMTDQAMGKIVDQFMKKNGIVIITADHGNVEEMIDNETGQVDTEHSIYPIPFIVAAKEFVGRGQVLPTGILADIAPTLIHMLGIPKPEGMTGRTLLNIQNRL